MWVVKYIYFKGSFIYFFYMRFARLFVHRMHAVPSDARRGRQIPLNWNRRWLCVTTWVLGMASLVV